MSGTVASGSKPSGAKRRRTKVNRIVNFFRKFVAFLFSHVGLCGLVVGYSVLGAVVFRAIERPPERQVQHLVVDSRQLAIRQMWQTTFDLNVLYETNWTLDVLYQVEQFKKVLMNATRRGYDGKDSEENPQWTFSGSFLYALTVVTTIGYGHIAPRTYLGKGLTIVYAILGIPLMLLFLTNIGDVMAKIFKFVYSRTLKLKRRLLSSYRSNSRIRRQNSLGSSGKSARLQPPPPHSPRPGASGKDVEMVEMSELRDRNARLGESSADAFELYPEFIRMEPLEPVERISSRDSLDPDLDSVSVPISISLVVMVAYLIAGAVLFYVWEKWEFVDAFYFCYISLTTIGFGDLVPGNSIRGDGSQAQEKLVICSVYLLFGMALIAMCFNLAQEEVVNKVARFAAKLGVTKSDD